MKRWRWLPPTILGVTFLLLWYVTTQTGLIDPFLLPSPNIVAHRVVSGLAAGYLLDGLGVTLLEALLGCFAAAVIGIPFGFAIAHSPTLSNSTEPYLAASQAIPAIAVAPLLVTWIGYGLTPIVVLCAVIVVFPVVISTAVGVRSVDPDLIGAAKIDGASCWVLIHAIEMPLAGPNIMAGLRTGFTLAITGAVVGEMVIGGQSGLGLQLVTAQHVNDVPGMFAVIVLLALVAIAIYLVLKYLENRVVRAVQAA